MDSSEQSSSPQRLDQYIVQTLPSISRSYAAKLIEQGKVTVNKSPITKPGYKLHDNDDVIVDFVPEVAGVVPTITLPVIYEDDDCVVINKPIGLLSHSKGAFNPEATVASWLEPHLIPGYAVTDPSGNARAGIVHRLDRATSGVMICAKNPEALSWLQKQFSQRKVKKTYIAVVRGTLTPAQAIIDMPIERNPKAPQTFRVGANGRVAQTEYQVLETSEQFSLVELKPRTGRTHQLRVHLQQLGHPILGDTLYGGLAAERLFLHALSLEITIPSREHKVFEAPLPPIFKQVIRNDS